MVGHWRDVMSVCICNVCKDRMREQTLSEVAISIVLFVNFSFQDASLTVAHKTEPGVFGY